MDDAGSRPRPVGDSFGTAGETVITSHVRAQPLRTLRQRQWALLVLCVSSLMIILDASVINVALPSIRGELSFAQHNLAWVVNAYLIPFGGILLFAGRLGDLVGANRVFIAGVSLFTLASVACGFSYNQAMLIGSRFVQGVGGALATAVVLGMIVRMFPKRTEQTRALAFYTFVSSSGAVIGVLFGALVITVADWHWIFFANVPVGIVCVLAARRLLQDERDDDTRGVDLPGTVLLVGSSMLLVYAVVQVADHGWTSVRTVWLLVGAIVGLLAFVVWQTRANNPLVPPDVVRGRNVVGPNVVIALLATGPTITFFFLSLYLQQVKSLSVLQVGLSFLPLALVVATVSLKAVPRLVKKVDAKFVLTGGLAVLAAGLLWFVRLPADGHFVLDLLPGLLLVGLGSGAAIPAALSIAVADATKADSGVRSGLVNTTQQIGGALGLALLATVATGRTETVVADGRAVPEALTAGFNLAFAGAAGIVLLALVLTVVAVQPAVPESAPGDLDPTNQEVIPHQEDLTGAVNPDFLALGLSGTNMMAMLWSIAHGRRAVGVELRGDPANAVVHWTVYEDLYHHLAEIDRLIAERYGRDRVPRLENGEPFLLHRCFYAPLPSRADARADEVLTSFAGETHVAGVVKSSEFADDRHVDGRPQRTLTVLGAVDLPTEAPDRAKLGRPMAEVLGQRPSFQVGGREMLLVLRRYLQELERLDLEAGAEPRCRLFLYHRVVVPGKRRVKAGLFGRSVTEQDGFVPGPDGRLRIRIEAVRELESKGAYRRIRKPGTEVIDLGVPELFMIAEGLESEDAARLGFRQRPLMVDHGDGRGPVAAQADYLVGLMTFYLDSRYRQRLISEFDAAGNEYYVRQIAVGHEDDAEIAWICAEVPDFMTFDPILAGIVPPGTDPTSRKYFAGYQHLVRDYFLSQVAIMTELPKSEVIRTSIARVPQLFTVTAKSGTDALVAANGVVAGDSFGNADFLTSDGFNTGAIGHAARVARYWEERAAGAAPAESVRRLADAIEEDTGAWLESGKPAFRQPSVPNADPVEAMAREVILERTRKHRRSVAPVNHRDEWSRLNVFVGRLHAYPLAPWPSTHPAERDTTRLPAPLSQLASAAMWQG